MSTTYRYTAWTMLTGEKAVLNFHSIAAIADWADANGLNFNPSMIGKYENTYTAERCDGKPLNESERTRLKKQVFRNENPVRNQIHREVAWRLREMVKP